MPKLVKLVVHGLLLEGTRATSAAAIGFERHSKRGRPADATNSAHVDAFLDLKRLDVHTADGVGIVQNNPGLGLQVECEVAASPEVGATDGQDLFDNFTCQVVVHQVPLLLQCYQNRIGAVQRHNLGDEGRVFQSIVH